MNLTREGQVMKHLNRASGRSIARAFTLIEMMIVIVIIAVSVSVIVPGYQNGVIRENVSEGLSDAAAAKVAIREACRSDPELIPSNSSTGYSSTDSIYVSSITISNTCQEPWIIIRTRNTGALTNIVLSLDGYYSRAVGRVVWSCHLVSGQEKYKPKNCRVSRGNS